MTETILSLRGVRKSFGQTEIIRGVDLDLRADERHALIGPNGAGKSTVFHLISGHFAPSAGEIVFAGRRIDGKPPQEVNRLGLSRSFQITNIFPKLSVFENLRLAVMRPHGLQNNLWKLIARDTRIREGEMSYSEQRSLEIAMTLASDPKAILLDEPMAGMSNEETAYTAELIRCVTRGRALLIVEHDMQVVFAISDRISVLVYGEVIATGTPEEIRSNVAVKEAYLGEEVSA